MLLPLHFQVFSLVPLIASTFPCISHSAVFTVICKMPETMLFVTPPHDPNTVRSEAQKLTVKHLVLPSLQDENS